MIRLEQLQREMERAGMRLPLTQVGETVRAVAPDGSLVDLPPEALAVVAAHVPVTPSPVSPPSEKLAQMKAPRVLTGSRTADRDRLLAALLDVCEEAGLIRNQTRP